MALNKAYFCLFNTGEPFDYIKVIRRDIKGTRAFLERELVRYPGIDSPTDLYINLGETELLGLIDKKYEHGDYETDRDIHAAYMIMIDVENRTSGVTEDLGRVYGRMTMFHRVRDALDDCNTALQSLDEIERNECIVERCFLAMNDLVCSFMPLYKFMNRYYP